MPAYLLQRVDPQELSYEERQEAEKRLTDEINACSDVRSPHRNGMRKFMLEAGIWRLEDIDYKARCSYKEYLKSRISARAILNYMLGFDKIKFYWLDQQAQTLSGRQKLHKYQNQQLFLVYHPDTEIGRKFLRSRNKEKLVWDFQREAPLTLKKQIFIILHKILQIEQRIDSLQLKLNELKELYDFCIESRVPDIEYLEEGQIQKFYEWLIEKGVRKGNIIDFSRKTLFLDAAQINWNANVWYLERFHFESTRINPAKPVVSISFVDVIHKKNRSLLQQYMKYCLGTTNLTIGIIRTELSMIRRFLIKMQEYSGENICLATAADIGQYFNYLEMSDSQPENYNKNIISILHFFDYLKVRGYIEKIPFQEQYFLKKTVQKHHDRSVEHQVYIEIMQKLNGFPEDLRLMFLHQWAVGLRASEVCTLKGDAYYVQGRDAWVQVYQIKMKNFKRIPIPVILYRLMKVYLDKYQIQADEYIFKNTKGGAYHYETYKRRMLKYCKENRIANGEYLFQSHDYRHTLATFFYNHGVSIQGIRDYLGHTYEEMTEQYIDFMPRKIRKANEDYFRKEENSLASGIKKRNRNEK